MTAYAYPARIEQTEALTGDNTFEEAYALAEDCLICALGFYTDPRCPRPIPEPSPPQPGEHLIELPPLVVAKLALHSAMREKEVTDTDLAAQLGVTEAVVRRLLDLDHRSHIGQVEKALALLGKRLVVEVRDIAA